MSGSIKSEFSTEIKEVGKTIYPFVTKTRQKLIEKMLIHLHSRGAGSNLGQGGGGGSVSKKGTLFYFGKQAEKPNFKK